MATCYLGDKTLTFVDSRDPCGYKIVCKNSAGSECTSFNGDSPFTVYLLKDYGCGTTAYPETAYLEYLDDVSKTWKQDGSGVQSPGGVSWAEWHWTISGVTRTTQWRIRTDDCMKEFTAVSSYVAPKPDRGPDANGVNTFEVTYSCNGPYKVWKNGFYKGGVTYFTCTTGTPDKYIMTDLLNMGYVASRDTLTVNGVKTVPTSTTPGTTGTTPGTGSAGASGSGLFDKIGSTLGISSDYAKYGVIGFGILFLLMMMKR